MVFNVVIFFPHGYFGQANVLGLPDTGGQVPECDITLLMHGNTKNAGIYFDFTLMT